MDGWGWWFLWCYSLGPGSAELFFLQGWQQSGGGGRGGVWVLPPGDEGAGEVWARPQSEDVRGHCERGRRGGGRGALPGALLWLERQVRQDLGRNHLNVYFHPNSKENRPKKQIFKNPSLNSWDHRLRGCPRSSNPSSQFCFVWTSAMVSTLIMESTGPSSGRNTTEYRVDADSLLSFLSLSFDQNPLSVCPPAVCLSIYRQPDFFFYFFFLTNLKSFNNQTKLPILQCDIWMWANTEWPT